jgi:KH domain-containing protein
METIFIEKIAEIKRNIKELEYKLKVRMSFQGRSLSISGEAIDEYEASIIINAINFGFSAKQALSLQEPDMQFRILNIKDFTRRKNLKEVRARLIGTEGKTKRTLENVGNCEIVINDNEIGVIGTANTLDETTTAIVSLIRGSKQGNVYAFMEKMNRERKAMDDDLGLKDKKDRNVEVKKKKNKKKEAEEESEEDNEEDYSDEDDKE